MSRSSLTRDIAQMVMPRINGPELADPAYRAEIAGLIKEGMGGFILFGGDSESTPAFLAELQSQAEEPLLVTSDVERGLGQQLSGGTRFPGQRAVAAAIRRRSRKDEDLLGRMLDAVRTETRAAGIHAVFSPVMDVNNNPENPIICTRAFGEDPETVEWFGARYIKRLQGASKGGTQTLLACAKHYPGHGDTDQDSHSVLPVIRAERARLNRVELPPFREAVKSGVGMVMVAHLLVPALDPDKPVTFSKKAVTALLREGMEFEGLIVSDALDMGALAGRYSPEEIAVQAVHAGMDILLHPADARLTIRAVVAAVEAGALTHERVRESVARIREAKKRLGLFDRGLNIPPGIDYAKHRAIAREMAARVPGVVSGDRKLLPLNAGRGAACFVLDDDDREGTGGAFLSAMRERFGAFPEAVLTPTAEFSKDRAKHAVDAAGSAVIVLFSRISASKGRSGLSAGLMDAAGEIIRIAKSAGKRSIVVSFDSPYVLGRFADADVRIAAYDRMDEIQEAVAEMLTALGGERTAQGARNDT